MNNDLKALLTPDKITPPLTGGVFFRKRLLKGNLRGPYDDI
jgi:hypothetical protein